MFKHPAPQFALQFHGIHAVCRVRNFDAHGEVARICFGHHFARRRPQSFEWARHFARHGDVSKAEHPAQALDDLGKRRIICGSENQAFGDAFQRCHRQVRHALANGVAQPAEKVVLVFRPSARFHGSEESELASCDGFSIRGGNDWQSLRVISAEFRISVFTWGRKQVSATAKTRSKPGGVEPRPPKVCW